jgi:hypothetical protein
MYAKFAEFCGIVQKYVEAWDVSMWSPILTPPDPANVKKLSVVMSARLHQRAKRYALRTDQTLTELVITQLEKFLDSVESDSPTS